MKAMATILAAAFLLGCAERKEPARRERPLVFASIRPQAGLAKAVAGGLAEVRTLVGDGQSPHTYEPTARRLADLGGADAFFTIGLPFETQLIEKIAPLYPALPVVDGAEGVARRAMGHGHEYTDCAHGHGAPDPHIWLCPRNARAMAGNIARALQGIDPDHAEAYARNLARLSGRLEALEAEIATLLAPHRGARFHVYHPAFGYFAETYGLEQVAIEVDGKAPSPRQLAGLVERAREEGVRVLFVQKQFPMESAKAAADAIGGSVVQLDPLAEDVVENLRHIAESIARALAE